ncbi:MAG: hypothetical protein O3C67_00965 [Cyanobacteria bacterium]|nr:hypothetical protein [Cyanobacteriota bacterium]MEB3267002.1 hypothetical protein [Leptolyngbya sp.]
MADSVNYEKLAGVLNRASADGKASFCRMLWGNQSADVQAQLLTLLSAEAQAIVESGEALP